MVRAKRRSGIDPLAYMGDEPNTPFQGTVQLRSPNENDYANWNIGTFWINQNFSDPLNNEIWMLVSKINNVATWIMVGTGGGSVIGFPTDAGTATPAGGLLNILGGTNISTAGAGNTVTVNFDGILPVSSGGTGVATLTDGGVLVGSGTNPVTVTAVGTDGQVLIGATGADPAFATLTSADGTIVFAPGANTLDLGTGGAVAGNFPTDAGTAIPAAGILNILGGTGITTSGAGNTVTVDASGTVADNFPTDAGTAIPAAGILNILGGTGIATSGAGDTVTIDSTAPILTSGPFTPVLTFGGSSVGITYLRQEGMFAKVGTLCYIFITIELSSKGSSTGDCFLIGLPFPVTLLLLSDVDVMATALRNIAYPGGRDDVHGAIESVSNRLYFNSTGNNTGVVRLQETDLSNNSFFKFQGIYFTT